MYHISYLAFVHYIFICLHLELTEITSEVEQLVIKIISNSTCFIFTLKILNL